MGDSGKPHRNECTGHALETIKKNSRDDADITFFAACFCPFVQRVWTTLEFLDIPYKYYEVDPYKKPQELLEVSPKGLVPGLRLNNNGKPLALNESAIIVEYLEDLASSEGRSLLPPKTDPYARAVIRLQCEQFTKAVTPAFYRFIQAQDPEKQAQYANEFTASLDQLVELLDRGEKETKLYNTGGGLWREGGQLNLLDVIASPWILRASIVLPHYRGYELPSNPKFKSWVQRLLEHPSFKATCSTDDLYLDSYERYAYNRPNTSMVANAINAGQALP